MGASQVYENCYNPKQNFENPCSLNTIIQINKHPSQLKIYPTTKVVAHKTHGSCFVRPTLVKNIKIFSMNLDIYGWVQNKNQ